MPVDCTHNPSGQMHFIPLVFESSGRAQRVHAPTGVEGGGTDVHHYCHLCMQFMV